MMHKELYIGTNIIWKKCAFNILVPICYNISTGNTLPDTNQIGGIYMKGNAHFIYEADNIPDHRSRQFGHCPCLLAVIKSPALLTKKPYLSGNSDTANAK